MTIKEITPTELAEKLNQFDNIFLLDVREANEVAICNINGATHIPMNLIPLYLDKIPDEIDIIIYCHHGIRSLNVANYLAENGFDTDYLYNLTGGIDAWACIIDQQMPRY
ncbi:MULTISPECIES: rhodanese-like domain-containing protein [unclassified Gilliamella]|uniref:rhodanese-like domain-containing protein n=1 Tax=unclassified Gilliamella TaxID=2685620 RepID=UPI001326E7AD|nr:MULTISPECIES: rhodanese-like domain-containing protein [unclassified Gilliamella]MWN06105.1 sulfurtransferase [Gilliamella sp. Pas-s95]MWP61337.1 sulfurtransferase [Gilliamella sp. Pas-s25]